MSEGIDFLGTIRHLLGSLFGAPEEKKPRTEWIIPHDAATQAELPTVGNVREALKEVERALEDADKAVEWRILKEGLDGAINLCCRSCLVQSTGFEAAIARIAEVQEAFQDSIEGDDDHANTWIRNALTYLAEQLQKLHQFDLKEAGVKIELDVLSVIGPKRVVDELAGVLKDPAAEILNARDEKLQALQKQVEVAVSEARDALEALIDEHVTPQIVTEAKVAKWETRVRGDRAYFTIEVGGCGFETWVPKEAIQGEEETPDQTVRESEEITGGLTDPEG
ncbi:hypothetical protein OAO01_01580 [Oligoflexia bacterium]|nr:hypothetical protein [Oligoflexia bacterium]